MPKKLLFVTVLLLLVSVQALAVSCDIRCSLMGASTDNHAPHVDMHMPHCHGMAMQHDAQTSVTASGSCSSAGCGTEFQAMAKSSSHSETDSNKLPVSAVALLVDPFASGAPGRTIPTASLSRTSDSRPFAQRPGSSLRI